MRPTTPALYLSAGRDDARRLPAHHTSPEVVSAGERLDRVIELDAAVSGRHRAAELSFLNGLPEMTVLADQSQDAINAYGCVRTVVPNGATQPEAFIGPCGARSEAELAGITRAVIELAVDRAGRIHLIALGSHPSLPTLIGAGFRIDDMDTLMTSDLALIDGQTYAPSGEFG